MYKSCPKIAAACENSLHFFPTMWQLQRQRGWRSRPHIHVHTNNVLHKCCIVLRLVACTHLYGQLHVRPSQLRGCHWTWRPTIKGMCSGQECRNYTIKSQLHGCWCNRAVEVTACLSTSQQFLGALTQSIFSQAYMNNALGGYLFCNLI